jgi:hypothetical protein
LRIEAQHNDYLKRDIGTIEIKLPPKDYKES